MPFLRSAEYHFNRFHPKQEMAWIAYKAGMELVLAWGRRSGKSDFFIEVLIEDIEDYGKDCLYVAKTQRQARKIVWKKLKRRLKDHKDWKLRESSMEADHIPSGASISLYGADIVPDNMTGSGYRLIVCDEFALWKKPEIKESVLAPMLGDYVGQMLVGSTKRGKNHFHALEQRAKAEPDKFFCSEATIFDNTFLTDAGREKVISEYPGREKNPLYRQEILNEYVVFEGMVFALEAHTYIEPRWHAADLEHSYHWRGMDHGYSPDPTACVWIAYNHRKGYFQIYSEYKQQALLIKQHADIIALQEPYPIEDSISDIDPQVIAEYEAVGLRLTKANKKDKKARLLSLVNALRTGRLKITPECTQLLSEMASLTWEQIDKKTGEDHLCFVAGTQIRTLRGLVPIELVTMSDQVLTRDGYMPVRACGYTGEANVIEVSFSDGNKIICTGNHPIYTENRGFVRADSLTYADIFCTEKEWSKKKRSFSTELRSGATQNLSPEPFVPISFATQVSLRRAFDSCIERFGNLITGRFLTGGTSTTRTAIQQTIGLKISNVSLAQATKPSTKKRTQNAGDPRNISIFWRRFAHLPRSGTHLKRAWSGTVSTVRRFLETVQKSISHAQSVIGFIRQPTLALAGQSIAPAHAARRHAVTPDLIMRQGLAEFAAGSTKKVDLKSPAHAAMRAHGLLSVKTLSKNPVYNLSVKNLPEYFANGVLVHNCDALDYGFHGLILPQPKEEKPREEVYSHNPREAHSQDFGY